MAFAFVQSRSAAFAISPDARTLAYTNELVSGNLLVAVISTYTVDVTVTVSDDWNGSWTIAGTYAANVNVRTSIWRFPNTVAATPTVTVTPSGNAYVTICILEYSGGATSAELNSTSTNTGTSATPTTGSCTAAVGELIVAGYGQGSTTLTSATADSPFTMRESILNGSSTEGIGVSDHTSAAGNENAGFTLNTSVGWAAAAASFKLAAAAALAPKPVIISTQAILRAVW